MKRSKETKKDASTFPRKEDENSSPDSTRKNPNKDERVPQEKFVKILNQIVPFILHTSYYMTDLVYTLYYVMNCEVEKWPKSTEEKQHLLQLKNGLSTLVVDLRNNFRALLDESDIDEGETLIILRGLINKDIIYILYQVNDILKTELLLFQKKQSLMFTESGDQIEKNEQGINEQKDTNYGGLILQLQNCFIGFGNLMNFIRKIPLQNKYGVTKFQLDVLINVIDTDLLPGWEVQLDLLNCKLFNDLALNKDVVRLYREKTGDNTPDLTQGEAFGNFIGWLKDEIIGDFVF
ncbi:Cal4p NDAI_0C03000 [Naumovozyma dairenensis CBS 421]|uniref:Uncharacterized protein n=1 Tax=Naumovozyma dairenensis (strain ATCC 10597 / BCRC 20456 / CBS 421 / NBRC 0211 / NRRL Y-12639) TaxID=1071378 RepID=G0W849_NAUDC|nr:hypothetical protein NDAI_0C03000 [Naumovozyma dairenensis CBS 421]CCD23960.1 hypothetical protein NDAI_0C03000 [Naumovozyma dairenensis CBS 421]